MSRVWHWTSANPWVCWGCNGRRADGTRSKRLVIGHLGERRGVEHLVSEPSGPVRSTVDDEHGPVGEGNELTHSAALEHVVVLFVCRRRPIRRFGRETLAVCRCWVRPCVVKWPGVVSVGIVGHVGTTTEEDGRGIVVGWGEWKHRDRARSRVYMGDTIGHIWEGLYVLIRISKK